MTGFASTFPTKVLVVDDEQTVLDVLAAVLKKHKLEAKGVLSGEEALEKFRDEAYCRHVTAQACELAMAEFRYDRLIDVFADTLADSI